jgi:hypothetical protein
MSIHYGEEQEIIKRIITRHKKINESVPNRYNTMDPLYTYGWGDAFKKMVLGGEETHKLRFRRGIVYATIEITEDALGLIESTYHIKVKTDKGGFTKQAEGRISKRNVNPVPVVVEEADLVWEDNKLEDLPSAPVNLKPYGQRQLTGGGQRVQCGGIMGATVRGLGRVLPNKEVEQLDVHNPREFGNALFIVGVSTLKGAFRLVLTDGEGWHGLQDRNDILKLSTSQKAIGEVQYMNHVVKFIINKAIELFFEE